MEIAAWRLALGAVRKLDWRTLCEPQKQNIRDKKGMENAAWRLALGGVRKRYQKAVSESVNSRGRRRKVCGPVRFEQRLSPLSPLFISLFSFIHIHSANTATLYTGKRSREEAQNLFPKTARLAAKSLRGPKSTPFRSADTPACEGGRIGRPTHTHTCLFARLPPA